jgi:hypothetical protein
MSADILPFRKKQPQPTPHPEYVAWAAERERARLEFEREQLRVPLSEWSRPARHMDLNVDWEHRFHIPVPAIVGLCCFGIGIAVGIMVGIALTA